MPATEESKREPHLPETLAAVDRLYAEHQARTSRYHRLFGWLVSQFERPWIFAALVLASALWFGFNLAAPAWGWRPFDPPPFEGAASVASVASLYLVIVIVATQRRDDRLARKREMLLLELAILAEKKSAKAIALMEELRRDIPHVSDRVDSQAEQMAEPADTHRVIDALSQRDGD